MSTRETLVCPDAQIESKEKETAQLPPDARDVIWVDWDGPNDPENPRCWSKRRRWIISFVGIFFCTLVSLSVSAYSIAKDSVMRELHTSSTLTLLGITMFTLTFGAAPLIIAPVSEVYGRSTIYFVSAFIFTLFFIPQALARNIETMLVCRFISGIAGSSAVSLVGGTLADVWSGPERSLPMSLFAFAAFGATGLGPVLYGYVEERHGFRIISWTLFAASGAFTATLLFILDETRASVLLSRKAARLCKETGDSRYASRDDAERGSFVVMMQRSMGRPVKMLWQEPVLIAATLYISFAWGVLYIMLVAIPIVFRSVYGFTIGESGATYVTQVLGSALGMGIDYFCTKRYLATVDKKGPEARLYTAMSGGVLLPLGTLLFAFTAYPQVYWVVPCIGCTVLYSGMFCIYLAAFSYLSDGYTLYASSALSAMSFLRNLVGAVFPLFTSQLFDRLGVQGAGGLVFGLSTILSVIPFVLFKYGARLRERSPFAMELRRAEEAVAARQAAELEAKTPQNV